MTTTPPPLRLIVFSLILGTAVGSLAAAEAAAGPGPTQPPEPHIPPPYTVQVGDAACTVLFDAVVPYDREALFATAPKEDLDQALAACGETGGKLPIPYTALLVRTPSNTVLVDTGAGPSKKPGRGRLLSSLAAAGVTAEQIDTVILTHAHLDHIGGTLRETGELAFPRARYVIARAEWDFWTQEQPDLSALAIDTKSWVRIAHTHLLPLRDRTELVDHDAEVRPGITVLLAPGHTPGHLLVQIESHGQKLLYVADLVLSPVVLAHPGWHSKFDLDPAAAQASMNRFLARAAADHALVAASHFPWPGLGRLAPAGDHWVWQPVSPSS